MALTRYILILSNKYAPRSKSLRGALFLFWQRSEVENVPIRILKLKGSRSPRMGGGLA